MSIIPEFKVPEHPLAQDNLTVEEMEDLDEVVIVDEASGSTFSVNLVAAAVLDLCDGEHSSPEIIQFLSETMQVEHETAVRDIEAILTEFVAYGLIRER